MANLDVLKSKVTDKASQDMLLKAQLDSVETCFDRMAMEKTQWGFGKSGVCCRNCHRGPCRIAPRTPKGICGADADTIVARNYLRQVVNGTAAHSDHARHLVLLLKRVAETSGECCLSS